MTKRSIVMFTLFGVVASACGGIRNLGDRVDAGTDARRPDGGGGAGTARDGRGVDTPGVDRPVPPDARPGTAPAPDARRDVAPADARSADAVARDGAGDARIVDATPTDAVAADAATDTPGPDGAVDASADSAIADTGVDTPPVAVDAMVVVGACPPGISLEMLCATYCRGITTACTGVSAQFPSEADCLATCTRPTWSCGTPAQTTGNTVFCRATHVGFAIALPPSAAAECSNAGPDSPTCR